MAEEDNELLSIRDKLSSEDRIRDVELTIDPGFVHRRLIETLVGDPGIEIIEELVGDISNVPEWRRERAVDHVYRDVLLKFCEHFGVRPLEEVVAKGSGNVFCSTETLAPCENIYETDRVISHWVPPGEAGWSVELHYSSARISADTLKMRLHQGADIAVVAQVQEARGDLLICQPLLMGFPWLRPRDRSWADTAMWWGHGFFENFIEDIEEFKQVRDTPTPDSHEPMKEIRESAFKACLCEILGDNVTKDWGGETSDHFSRHVHLGKRRVSAAFLLKGPAKYSPMGLNHLGKNNDQIVRLADEPADLLVVQHCHDITQAVKKTLRAFAVQPSRARRYCLIDGRDSLRLLQAYDLYDKALALSKS